MFIENFNFPIEITSSNWNQMIIQRSMSHIRQDDSEEAKINDVLNNQKINFFDIILFICLSKKEVL